MIISGDDEKEVKGGKESIFKIPKNQKVHFYC